MLTGSLLVVLAVASRLLSSSYHAWNLAPASAVALYAGAKLPRKWAWIVPLAAMFVSDLFLDYGSRWPLFGLTRWTVYGTLAATTLIGVLARSRKVRPWMLPGLSVLASTLFFVTTNFSTWAEGELYPMSLSGLATCYVMAIPFFWNSLAADLIGTLALFTLGSAIERTAARYAPARQGVEIAQPAAVELGEIA